MNDDQFNLSMRSYLKKVGITSQREIEGAVRDAVSKNVLNGDEKLKVSVNLTIDDIQLSVDIDGYISLS
tara:strand:+ start:153 stop:359 length:207 start_codon:yes stop_codon:yes gene_type:complete